MSLPPSFIGLGVTAAPQKVWWIAAAHLANNLVTQRWHPGRPNLVGIALQPPQVMQTLAHFSGPWQDPDRAAVLAAIEQTDATPDPLLLAHRWTCNLYPSEQGAIFTAARHGMSRVLTARSAEELAERLRNRQSASLAA